MPVEEAHEIQVLPSAGWDERIEVIQVGDVVRCHVIYGQNLVVVYDTLLGPLSGEFLKSRLAERRGERGLVVLNSHSDWDHYWGNQCFPATPILGLELCAERIEGEFGKTELARKQAEHPDYVAVRLVAPNVRLQGECTLDCGGLTLQLLHTPGHRPDHLAVYIPEIATLLPGDAVETPFALLDESNPDEDLTNMQLTLQRFLELKVDWLLCNHAPPQAGKELVQSNLDYYRRLIYKAQNSGSLEQLKLRFKYPGPADQAFYKKEHERICEAAWKAYNP